MVDLPPPEAPTSATTSPGFTLKLIPCVCVRACICVMHIFVCDECICACVISVCVMSKCVMSVCVL